MSRFPSSNQAPPMYPMTELGSGFPREYQTPYTVTQQPQLPTSNMQGGNTSQPQMLYMQGGYAPPNVVVNVAAPTGTDNKPRQWSTGLFDCCSDMGVCCFGLWCPKCQERKIAMDMNESCCLPYCVPGWLIVLRTKMRMQENIEGSVMDDFCKVVWCNTCALWQLAREIKLTRQ